MRQQSRVNKPRIADIPFPTVERPLEPPPGFVERAAEAGISFDAGDLERLGRFLALMLGANEVVNLTAVTDPGEAWERHILDSLTLLAVLGDLPEGARVIDVGTGGGLPGLPLAIAAPRLRFTLLDATGKKIRFVEHAARELGLGNVEAVQGRAEEEGAMGSARRGAYDAVVSRAVGRLPTLLELTTPFAKSGEEIARSEGAEGEGAGGIIALVKGQQADEELAEAKGALHLLHCRHAGTVETPTGRIVVIEKLRRTPKVYPRGNGEPKRRPLGVER